VDRRALDQDDSHQPAEIKYSQRSEPVVCAGIHRYSGLKQRMITERFGGLDEGLVSRDRRAIREKIETEPKIRKWFQDLITLST
jgi:hypothetical protein